MSDAAKFKRLIGWSIAWPLISKSRFFEHRLFSLTYCQAHNLIIQFIDNSMSNQIIHNQVDLILFEEGKFSVLNWLLREGRLDYTDYRKWRNGEIPYLEDHFKTVIPEIIADLKIARHYAGKLKLASFTHSFTSAGNQILHFCRCCPTNELIFSTDYEPAQDRVQMDLFFDSAPLVRSMIL